jgi:hypothetical protein
MSTKDSSKNEGINVRDEREFKLWVKLIASIQKDGGNISKPLEVLWRSVREEFDILEKKSKGRSKIYQS